MRESQVPHETSLGRFSPEGAIFDVSGPSGFPSENDIGPLLCLLNSKVVRAYMSIFNPTAHFQVGDMKQIPYIFGENSRQQLRSLADRAIFIAKNQYEEDEICPTFTRVGIDLKRDLIRKSVTEAEDYGRTRRSEMASIETEINNILISQYRLTGQLDSAVEPDEVTLNVDTSYDYVVKLMSFTIGCMMGRYSLDEPGLIYAHAGNVGFDPSRYARFAADADGILPVTDEHWFEDDAPARVREFLQAVWGPDTLAENLAWLAESLGTKGCETPEETIRRYIADKFYKDHLQTYKKRPIYWLFSSGKQGAFQALVYLHRYHEGTLARMRAEYVIPLSAKMAARLEMLEQDANAATSAAARTKVRKQIETLRKKQTELLAFDEKLRHYADMRITLDLDDGVKVNYGKFGDLLEGVKLVTGGAGDE